MRGWDRVIDKVIMSALGLVMGGLSLAHFVAFRLDTVFRASEGPGRALPLRPG
ncbi:hypothetical protein BH10PSE1_BH10PSE1_24600 [soil metagenome]